MYRMKILLRCAVFEAVAMSVPRFTAADSPIWGARRRHVAWRCVQRLELMEELGIQEDEKEFWTSSRRPVSESL